MVLGKSSGCSINLDIAAAGDKEVSRIKIKTIKALGLTDQIEDMLITLGNQVHTLRPMKTRPVVFLFVALYKCRSNLALARMKTADVDDTFVLQNEVVDTIYWVRVGGLKPLWPMSCS